MTLKLPFLSDDHHFAITSMAVRVGLMDWQIESLVATALTKQPTTAAFVLKNLASDRIVGLARAVLLDSAAVDSAAVPPLFAEIEAIRAERNELIHWIWGESPEGKAAIQVDARPFRMTQKKSRTDAEISAVADRAMKVIQTLGAWQRDILNQLHPALHETSETAVPQPNSLLS